MAIKRHLGIAAVALALAAAPAATFAQEDDMGTGGAAGMNAANNAQGMVNASTIAGAVAFAGATAAAVVLGTDDGDASTTTTTTTTTPTGTPQAD